MEKNPLKKEFVVLYHQDTGSTIYISGMEIVENGSSWWVANGEATTEEQILIPIYSKNQISFSQKLYKYNICILELRPCFRCYDYHWYNWYCFLVVMKLNSFIYLTAAQDHNLVHNYQKSMFHASVNKLIDHIICFVNQNYWQDKLLPYKNTNKVVILTLADTKQYNKWETTMTKRIPINIRKKSQLTIHYQMNVSPRVTFKKIQKLRSVTVTFVSTLITYIMISTKLMYFFAGNVTNKWTIGKEEQEDKHTQTQNINKRIPSTWDKTKIVLVPRKQVNQTIYISYLDQRILCTRTVYVIENYKTRFGCWSAYFN